MPDRETLGFQFQNISGVAQLSVATRHSALGRDPVILPLPPARQPVMASYAPPRP